MFTVANSLAYANGTSRVGDIELCYADIVLAFGEPLHSDEYKVSGEWVFVNSADPDEVYTLYDWKSTSIYDPSLPSVEEFRKKTVAWFNIGGFSNYDVERFKLLLKQHIEWVKSGKPFEEMVLGVSSPVGLISGGK